MHRTLASFSIIASLVAAGAAFAGPAPGPDAGPGGPAHGAGHGHGPGRGGPFMHELRDLDLTDSQHAQIREFVKAGHERSDAARSAGRDLHHRYLLAVPGTTEFRALTAQVADAEAAEARNRVQEQADVRTQIYGVLTPAQKKKLAEELANRPLKPEPPKS